MFAGGKDSLKALQAASVVVALPLMVVLALMVFSLMRWLKEDYPTPEFDDTIVSVPLSSSDAASKE